MCNLEEHSARDGRVAAGENVTGAGFQVALALEVCGSEGANQAAHRHAPSTSAAQRYLLACVSVVPRSNPLPEGSSGSYTHFQGRIYAPLSSRLLLLTLRRA